MKRNFERISPIICSKRSDFPTFAEQKYSVHIRIKGLSDYDYSEEGKALFQYEYVLTPCGNGVSIGWDTLLEKEEEAKCLCDLLEINPCTTQEEVDWWCMAYDVAKAEYSLFFEMM